MVRSKCFAISIRSRAKQRLYSPAAAVSNMTWAEHHVNFTAVDGFSLGLSRVKNSRAHLTIGDPLEHVEAAAKVHEIGVDAVRQA